MEKIFNDCGIIIWAGEGVIEINLPGKNSLVWKDDDVNRSTAIDFARFVISENMI